LNERLEKGKNEIALQAQSNNVKKGKGNWSGNIGRGGYQNTSAKDNQETSNPNQKTGGRGGFNGNNRGVRGGRGGYKGFDKSNIQCYNCQKFGHFADECRGKNEAQEAEARVAKQNEREKLEMLMVTIKDESDCSGKWYLDSGCSTHMKGVIAVLLIVIIMLSFANPFSFYKPKEHSKQSSEICK
jgi:hypothetical protein